MSVFSLSGVLCCVLLLFCAAASPLLAKAGIRRADVTAAGAWRSTLLFLFLLLPGFFGGFSFREVFASLSGFRQWLFFLLGLAMAGGAWLLYNNALKHGTVVRTISLLFILPLPLFLLSLWLFPETRFSPFTKSGLTAIFAMLLFFVALILLCVHQNGKWVRSGLLMLLLAAGALICFRFTPLSLTGGSIPLCIPLFALLSWLSLLFGGHRSLAFDIRLRDFLLLLLSAAATAGALLFYRLALQKDSEALALLFLGLSLLLLLPFAFLFLKERPSKNEAAALVILTAAILLRTLPSVL